MAKSFQDRVFAGLLIILIGVVFLLGSLDKLNVGHVFSKYWPLIIVFFGLWHVFSRSFQNAGFGFVLILIGGFFMLVKLKIVGVSVWSIMWPLLIIFVGLWLIFKPRFRGIKGGVPKTKEDDLDLFAMFSGIERKVESSNFRGGKATALFGGLEIEFTNAQLAEQKATVELTAIFGGIDVWIPQEWKVVVDSNAFFGGVDNKHRTASDENIKGTIFIKANCIFGGIDIK